MSFNKSKSKKASKNTDQPVTMISRKSSAIVDSVLLMVLSSVREDIDTKERDKLNHYRLCRFIH
jgi:hypothetical protein